MHNWDKDWWRSGQDQRFLVLGLLSLVVITAASSCFAMPTARQGDGTAKPLRPNTLFERSLFDDPSADHLAEPYKDLFDKKSAEGEALYRIDSQDAVISLSPEEQKEIRNILETPKELNLNGSDKGWLDDDAGSGQSEGPLLQQFVAEVDALYAELASTDPNYAPSESFGAGANGTGGPPVLRIIRAPRNDNLPLLSAIPIGTIFVESIKSLVESGDLDRSLVSGLRDFVLVEQPGTGFLMMVDSGSGYTLMLRSPHNAAGLSFKKDAPPQETRENNRQRERAPVERRPLHLKIWDIITSLGAFVFYGIAIVCWAAWHYVISRYA